MAANFCFPADEMKNIHTKRLRSQRKDSARCLPKGDIEKAKELVATRENVRVPPKIKHKSYPAEQCIHANSEDIITPKPVPKPAARSNSYGTHTAKLHRRNASSPQLSRNFLYIPKTEESLEPTQRPKVTVSHKNKKRKLSLSISSRLALNGPISHPSTPLKLTKKITRKRKAVNPAFKELSDSPALRSHSSSHTYENRYRFSRENDNPMDYDPFSSATTPLFRVSRLNSPGRKRPSVGATTPSRANVEIYARHSGLSASSVAFKTAEVSAEQTKRLRIIQELRDTERSYVTSLHMVSVLFLTPLRAKMNTPKQILSAKELKSIFGNIEDVCRFSQKFLEALEVRIHPSVWTDESTIGDIFNSIMDQSNMSDVYHEYIDTYETALGIIRTAFHSENSLFGEFAREKQISCDNHSLSSLLVSPVQRVPRYQLLLEDLIKATPIDHPDKQQLTLAHKKMVALANSVNESKWREESQEKMREISLKFKKCFHSDFNVKGRELLTQGEILQYNAQTKEKELFTLFVFNDLLVCASASSKEKAQSKLKVIWKARLVNCHVEFIDGETESKSIFIKETRLIEDEPYLVEQIQTIYSSEAPYDFSFWKRTLQNAIETFLWDSDRLLVDSSAVITNHMKNHLIGEREQTMLQIGAKKASFLRGENICKNTDGASDACYFVNYGQVGIQKFVDNEWTTVDILRRGGLFGEYSYLLGSEFIRKKNPLRYVALTDSAIVTRVSFGQMDYLFHRNPSLALNFFKAHTFILSQLFIFQTFILHNTHLSTSFLYFIQQLNMFLHQKDPTKSVLTDNQTAGEKKNSRALLAKLKLPPTEVVLAHYNCKIKRDLRNGILVIFTDYIIVANTLFGHLSNQTRILHEHILNFQLLTDHCLEIVLENEQSLSIQLQSPACLSEVLQLLSVLVEQNQMKIEKSAVVSDMIDSDISLSMHLLPNEWETICSYAEILEFVEGEIVEEQGSITCCLYRVRSGLVSVSRKIVSQTNSQDIRDLEITKKIVGQFFGEIGFVFGTVATASIIAQTDGSCWKFTRDKIEKLIMHHPVVGAKLYRALGENLLSLILEQEILFEGLSQPPEEQ